MIQPSGQRNIPPALSLVLIVLCLGTAFWLTWWYVKGEADSQTIVLNDLPGPPVSQAPKPTTRPNPATYRRRDAVVAGPNHSFMINSGPYFVRVQPSTRPSQETTFVFRVRNAPSLGVLPPETALLRRGFWPAPLRNLLALSGAQMQELRAIATTQPSNRNFQLTGGVAELTPDQLAQLRSQWASYASADATHRAAAEATLTRFVRQLGDSIVQQQRSQQTRVAQAIRNVLTPQQMRALQQWRAISATQPTLQQTRAAAARAAAARRAAATRPSLQLTTPTTLPNAS